MKRLYSIIIAAMLVFSIAACGETAGSNEKTEASAKEAEYSEETTPLEEKQEDNNETEVTAEPSKEEVVASEPAFEEKEIEFPETTILFDSYLEKVELLSFFAKYDESSKDKKPITGFTVRVTNNSDRKIVLKPQEVKLEGKDLVLGEIDPISLKPDVSTTRDIVVFKDKELETPIDSIEELYDLTGTFYMSVYNEDNKTVEVTSSGKYEFDISQVEFGVDITEIDKSKAGEVDSLINAIGEVGLGSEDVINAAREAYDKLTKSQKEMVEFYDTLTSAEETLNALKTEERIKEMTINIGDTVTSNDWNIVLTNAYSSDILESDESRIYWEASDGYAFCVLEFDVTCLNSSKPTIDDQGITNLIATVNNNTYENWEYQYVESELWLHIRHTYLDANLPLHIYVYTNIPSANINDEIIVNLKIAGEEKAILINH